MLKQREIHGRQIPPLEILPDNLIWLGLRGSLAHGTHIPPEDDHGTDDKDVIGVFMGTKRFYYGFDTQDTIERKFQEGHLDWDGVYYELRKLFRLLLKQNPNVLAILWTPEEHVLFRDYYGDWLVENRDLFISKQAYFSFMGYVKGQRRRMVRFEQDNPVRDSEIAEIRAELAHREMMKNMLGDGNYARYPWQNWNAKSLRKRLNDLSGTQGYMGKKRRGLVEKYGYDVKNAAHMIRLLEMLIEFLDSGYMRVDRTGRDAVTIKEIKSGQWSLEKVQKHTDDLMNIADKAFDRSRLPDEPAKDQAEHLCIMMLDHYMNR